MIYLLIFNAVFIGFSLGMYVSQRMTKKVFKAADEAIDASNNLISLLKIRINLYESHVDEHILH